MPPVPVPNAMMYVPAYTPVPEIGMPTEREPEITAATVSVETAIVPVNVAPMLDPAYIGTAVATVDAILSVYEPAPPDDAATVITVPAATPEPETGVPTESEPEMMDVTVSAVLDMVPRKVAAMLAPALMVKADATFGVVESE